MRLIPKTQACRKAWASLPPGEYRAEDVAEAANKLGISKFCYRQDAENALRLMKVPKEIPPFEMRCVYRKED